MGSMQSERLGEGDGEEREGVEATSGGFLGSGHVVGLLYLFGLCDISAASREEKEPPDSEREGGGRQRSPGPNSRPLPNLENFDFFSQALFLPPSHPSTLRLVPARPRSPCRSQRSTNRWPALLQHQQHPRQNARSPSDSPPRISPTRSPARASRSQPASAASTSPSSSTRSLRTVSWPSSNPVFFLSSSPLLRRPLS